MDIIIYISSFLFGWFGRRSYYTYAFSNQLFNINRFEIFFIFVFLFLFSLSLLAISQYLIYFVLFLYIAPIIRLMFLTIDADLTVYAKGMLIIWMIFFFGFLYYYIDPVSVLNIINSFL